MRISACHHPSCIVFYPRGNGLVGLPSLRVWLSRDAVPQHQATSCDDLGLGFADSWILWMCCDRGGSWIEEADEVSTISPVKATIVIR